jgi:hypothetical protein
VARDIDLRSTAMTRSHFLLGGLEQPLAGLDADVVVEDVEAPQAGDGGGDHRVTVGAARHVGGVGLGLAPLASSSAAA